MRLSVCSVAIVLLLVAWSPRADKPASSPAKKDTMSPTSFVGCYEVRMGRWWPWGFGKDTGFVTPPGRVQLLAEPGKEGFEKYGFLIRQLPSKGRGGPTYWRIEPNHKVDLVWTDGFTSVTLSLERHGNTLRGWAHPHFDMFRFIPRIAHVIAHRIACPSQ